MELGDANGHFQVLAPSRTIFQLIIGQNPTPHNVVEYLRGHDGAGGGDDRTGDHGGRGADDFCTGGSLFGS